MFGFFKKKEKKPVAQSAPSEAFKEFSAQFLPEERSILAVTGANGLAGSSRAAGSKLWKASMGLTAWMEEGSPDIHREMTELVTLADGRLMEYLGRRVPPDFMIKFKGRVSEDGKRILLLDLPEPGFDPDLKAILEEQKKPVTLQVDGLGTFTLNRHVDWFEAEVDWLGSEITLSFDREDEEPMKKSQDTAKTLLAAAADWDKRVREYAADELLDLANDWSQDMDEDGEAVEVTREQFMDRMELEAIQVDCWGGFGFWFGGELFCGHSIHVTGGLEDGPHDACMEG